VTCRKGIMMVDVKDVCGFSLSNEPFDRNESISSNSLQVYTGVTYTQTTNRLALNIIQDGYGRESLIRYVAHLQSVHEARRPQ